MKHHIDLRCNIVSSNAMCKELVAVITTGNNSRCPSSLSVQWPVEDGTVELVFSGSEEFGVISHKLFPGDDTIAIRIHCIEGGLSVFLRYPQAVVEHMPLVDVDFVITICIQVIKCGIT